MVTFLGSRVGTRGLLTAALFAAALASPGPAVAQAISPAPQSAQPMTPGNMTFDGTPRPGSGTTGETATGGGNYDYFTAPLRPDLAAYLAQVSARHASERVWALYWAGKYPEPLGDCEYALARFPNHPRALHLIGEISKAMNNVSLAIPYFEYALSLYPQYAFTHAQYGNYLISIGVNQAGVAQLREALRLDPNQFQAKAWLAEAIAAHPELAQSEPSPPKPAPSAITPGQAPSKESTSKESTSKALPKSAPKPKGKR